MAETYLMPISTADFGYGTKYQIKDKATGEWGYTRQITKVCWSVRMELRELIEEERIRLVCND